MFDKQISTIKAKCFDGYGSALVQTPGTRVDIVTVSFKLREILTFNLVAADRKSGKQMFRCDFDSSASLTFCVNEP